MGNKTIITTVVMNNLRCKYNQVCSTKWLCRSTPHRYNFNPRRVLLKDKKTPSFNIPMIQVNDNSELFTFQQKYLHHKIHKRIVLKLKHNYVIIVWKCKLCHSVCTKLSVYIENIGGTSSCQYILVIKLYNAFQNDFTGHQISAFHRLYHFFI